MTGTPSQPPHTIAGVNTSERIESLFDSIEYNKGAAVLRMLRAWVNRGAGLGALEAAAGINPAQVGRCRVVVRLQPGRAVLFPPF